MENNSVSKQVYSKAHQMQMALNGDYKLKKIYKLSSEEPMYIFVYSNGDNVKDLVISQSLKSGWVEGKIAASMIRSSNEIK